ncbi:uncharacterized protein LOC116212906 [Punica granatum]|uniref:AAA+ ATPase domain-containing protein n=2 Tax=Punica granatum TaxID=22663 RepID=A0A218XMD0_PUNGR|nr:uncharacterized protein LOC116212906 [Punica granatum]XP_031403509.1 uncharacterized protein LOC116212906 [Punica granatum]OWM85950.1 hypothetical protein CDL15_Pgr012200 [Punica granatum]PKI35707.1 hypothetical protein CRG98_043865 [Punica granatum]
MEEKESSRAAPEAIVISSGLTIKIANLSTSSKKKNPTVAAAGSAVSTVEPSPYNSPSLISPPSSAFVSALQSPYISPRALTPKTEDEEEREGGEAAQLPCDERPKGAGSSSGHSDDLPSSSYTPPSDQYEFSDDPNDEKLKFLPYVPVQVPVTDPTGAPPRISFSFPVPRVSFTKGPGPVSPAPAAAANAKLRSCDVFVGFHGQSPNLVRFCKWLKSELELQGIACFVADRTKYSDAQSHEIADRVICSVTFGIVVLANSSFLNPLSMEEVKFFTQKKNLVPIFFDTGASEILSLLSCSSADKDTKEAIERSVKCNEFKVEANEGNWRSCIARAARILRSKLGRTSVAEKDVVEAFEEIPFPRNRYFIGREREMMEIEAALFGCGEGIEQEPAAPGTRGEASGQSEGLADEESESFTTSRGSRFINLEVGSSKCKEPKLEAWVEPVLGRNSFKRSSKSKKSRIGSGVLCINGVPGVGKTELALEFAHRFSQRYKMVLWVGGEARYFRQNILNLSVNLGLDVSADLEKERGRIRSFDEQEMEAFKRVKRELFRDMPYLIIIDNLETEKEWWEGKDLHDLIPRNTGGSHVIITTRLTKVMTFDILPVPPLPVSDLMVLMRGRRMREYPAGEVEVLQKFAEKLGRVSFGMWVVGSMLSELGISPSALYEEVNRVPLEDELTNHHSSMGLNDEQFCKNNPFLMKVLSFCFNVLQQVSGRRNLVTLKMLLAGAWFAPAPVPATLLAAAAKSVPETGNQFEKWSKMLGLSCCLAPKAWKTEEDSAILLVKLGLARRSNRGQGYCVQFHPITQLFARRKDSSPPSASSSLGAKAMVQAVRRMGNPVQNSDHLWASAFLVFGFKSEPPLVQLKPIDAVLYIKRTALPLAIKAFTTFSRCNSALELLKVCTNVLEEVEKSFVSQIQDWCHGSLCWKKSLQGASTRWRVDEYVWQDVTLLKATLLETRAKLLLRGGHFDSGEELCRTCISIRTVMLGHNHAQTLAAQETLAKLVRMRSKI